MLALEDIIAALSDRRIPMVQHATGLSYNTIANIRDGRNRNPEYSTLKALSDYLDPEAQAKKG
jgi:hypothetical protein